MNENNANWHIIPGNLSFFLFRPFPEQGLQCLSLTFSDTSGSWVTETLSPLGALRSEGWLLCQLLRPRGANREGFFFFPTARKRWHSITVTPMSCFFLTAQSPPRNTHLPRHYTRTQASLWRWESLFYYVTQSQARGPLKNVLMSRVTPSVSQKPGGLQGTLLSCDCAFFGRKSPSNVQGGFYNWFFYFVDAFQFLVALGEVVLSSYVPL